ncbi:MAG TPA: aspartate--tRNA(Asn) ligase, partial [Clostridiales bacterium]|nr:aspartate--tRNA(Asn) ligase [Clostridiales bacterium]
MERVLVRDLMELENKEVRLFGWIHNIKAFKEFSFVYLRDRSGIVQMIIDDEKVLSSLKLESSVKVSGKVQMNEKAPDGVEIIVSELEVVG